MSSNGDIANVARLACLLAALTRDWEDRDALMDTLSYPNENDASARRMFRRDIQALQTLGFLIERRGGHPPAYRLVGHARWRI